MIFLKNHKHVFLFLLLFLLIVFPYCFLGFDVTDYGYILYGQQEALKSGINIFRIDVQTPLSQMMGGVLQYYFYSHSLLFAKIFGLLIFVINESVVYFTILLVFEIKNHKEKCLLLFLIVGFSLIALCPSKNGTVLLPSYDTLPILFSVIFISVLIHFVRKKSFQVLSLAYLAFFILFFLKVTMVLFLFFPGLVLLRSISRREPSYRYELIYFLLSVGIASSYILYSISSQPEMDSSYGIQAILLRDYTDLKNIYVMPILLSVMGLIGIYLERKSKAKLFVLLLGICTGLFITSYFKSSNFVASKIINLTRSNFSYSITISLAIAAFLMSAVSSLSYPKRFLLLMAALVPFFLDAGTNTGLAKMGYGIVLVAATIFAVLLEKSPIISKVFFRISFAITVIALVRLYTTFYRDLDQIAHLNVAFSTGKFKNIRTNSPRKNDYEELLNESLNYIHPGDIVLAYDSNPLFYWATDTIAYEGLSWPDMFSSDQIDERISKVCNDNGRPKIILRSIINTRTKSWPEKSEPFSTKESEKIKKMDQLVDQNCKPTRVLVQ